MANSRRDSSFQDPLLPRGTAVVAVLVAILAAGILLIIHGLL